MAKGSNNPSLVDDRVDSQNSEDQIDLDNAKRVRDTFLSYRKQLTDTLKLLNEHTQQGDSHALRLEQDVMDLLLVLDRLERKKSVTADTLTDFLVKIRGVADQFDSIAGDVSNNTSLAQAIRARRHEIVEEDHKQDKRFKELGKQIGGKVDEFIRDKSHLIGTGGGSALKLAMASWLGPAAPLVSLVDQLVDIDGRMEKVYAGSVSAVESAVKATVALPGKLVRAGGAWSQVVVDYMRSRAAHTDRREDRRDKTTTRLLREQLVKLREMKRKLGDMAKSTGRLALDLLTGLGSVIGRAISTIKGIITSGLAGLAALLPGKMLLSKLAGLIAGGAAKVFGRHGASARDAAGAGSRFGRQALGERIRGAAGHVGDFVKNNPMVGKVGKTLGVVGGAWGLADSFNNLADAPKGRGLFEGGLDSRAANYGSSVLSGATMGASIGSIVPGLGTVLGGVIGGAMGGVSAAVADNKEAVTAAIDDLWRKAGVVGSRAADSAEAMVSRMSSWWDKSFESMSKSFDATVTRFSEGLGTFLGDVRDWFADLSWDKVKGQAKSLASKATAAVLDGVTHVKDVVKNSTGVDMASYLPEGVRKTIRQAKAGAGYEGVKGTIIGAAQESGVSAGRLARIGQIESGFRTKVTAGTSTAGGLMQFTNSTWGDMLKKHGKKYNLDAGTSKFDPRANTLMAAEYLKDNEAHLKRTTGAKVGDTELYLAHFLGPGGAETLLKAMAKNPNQSAAAIMPDAAASNKSVFYEGGRARTVAEIYSWADAKIRSTDAIAAKAMADAGETPAGAVGAVGKATSAAQGAAGPVSSQPVSSQSIEAKPVGRARPEAQVTEQAKVIPRSVTPPTVDAAAQASPQQVASTPSPASMPKSNLNDVPFMPDDQNLLLFNIAGIIG